MSANFRFVPHSTETDPDEFTTERVGDGLAETRLTDAGWPEETQNRAVAGRIQFADGEIFLGMMPGSRKLHDLERDPRLALHSPSEDPPPDDPRGWPGEAKIAGRAVEVDFPDSPVAGGRRWRIEIREAVLTRLNDAGDQLVVESWHPEKGVMRLERR